METNLYIWLAAGIVFLVAEAFGNGFGIMFAGLGALVVGMLINLEIIDYDAVILQFVAFFAATAFFALLLWKPMKKWQSKNKKHSYSNMVGDVAVVAEAGISKEHGGNVLWSGTIMKARLAEGEHHKHLEAGTNVTIQDISGNTLIVTTKAKE